LNYNIDKFTFTDYIDYKRQFESITFNQARPSFLAWLARYTVKDNKGRYITNNSEETIPLLISHLNNLAQNSCLVCGHQCKNIVCESCKREGWKTQHDMDSIFSFMKISELVGTGVWARNKERIIYYKNGMLNKTNI